MHRNGTFPIGTPVSQNRTVVKGEDSFIVRLLTGIGEDPAALNSAMKANSEWERLFNCVHVNGNATEKWASYTDDDLQFAGGSSSQATMNSVQESLASDTARNIFRRGITGTGASPGDIGKTFDNTSLDWDNAWRPVLELVV